MRDLSLGLWCLPLVLGQVQNPMIITTTSCRSWPATRLASPTQVTAKPSTTTPPLTSLCATTTRPARVSLKAESGTFAYVYDNWGTCNQFIEFAFNANWTQYTFGMAWYDDPNQGCNGVPTSTMSCGIGISSQLTKDETYKLSPTQPHAAQVDPSQTAAGWIYCNPA